VTLTLLLVAALGPLVLAYVVACFRDPLRYALPAYAVSIQFSSLISVGPGPFGSVSSLLGVLLGVSLLAQLITARPASPRLPLVVPVWLAFLALCGFSLFWSIDPEETASRFAVLSSLVLLFVALALTRFDRAAFERFETALIVGGVLVVCYGLAQMMFLGGFPTPDGGAARFGNDLLGPNNQAASLLLPIAISAGRALRGSIRWRVVHGAALLLLALGVVMTGSRGGLLAMLVTLGAIVVFGGVKRAAAVGLAAAATVLVVLVLLSNPGGIGQRQLELQTDASGRDSIWTIGLHACSEYCLTGAGWGSFPTVYATELPEVPEARILYRGSSFEAHNIFLLVGVEAGAAGLVLLFLALGMALAGALRLPIDMRGPPLAALLGIVLSGFFLSNLEYKFFWAVLMYVVVAESFAATTRGGSPGARPPGEGRRALREDVR
jgi:O-antigen ligase